MAGAFPSSRATFSRLAAAMDAILKDELWEAAQPQSSYS
jgi:hypothetical protein